MATKPEDLQQDQSDFRDAFNEDQAPPQEMSEDEAFGLGPVESNEPPAEAAAEGEAAEESGVEAASSGAEGAAGDDVPSGDAPAIAIVVEPGAEQNSDVESEEPTDPKDIQRAKSWEGRLRAKEAELKAREEALNKPTNEPSEPGETMAQEQAEPPAAEAIEQAVEQVQSGAMTADQALQALAGDFGDDFAKALGVLIESKAAEIAGRTADEKVGQVSQKLDGVVNHLVDDRRNSHFESIADAHEDYMDIAASPVFKDYIDGMDEESKAAAVNTIERGRARDIITLLNKFKASTKVQEPSVEDGQAPVGPDEEQMKAMDAAEGVRSKGMKLPEKPNASQEYAEAWESF